MIQNKTINNKELMSVDDYVFDGTKWVSASEYTELLEMISADIDEHWNEKDIIDEKD